MCAWTPFHSSCTQASATSKGGGNAVLPQAETAIGKAVLFSGSAGWSPLHIARRCPKRPRGVGRLCRIAQIYKQRDFPLLLVVGFNHITYTKRLDVLATTSPTPDDGHSGHIGKVQCHHSTGLRYRRGDRLVSHLHLHGLVPIAPCAWSLAGFVFVPLDCQVYLPRPHQARPGKFGAVRTPG